MLRFSFEAPKEFMESFFLVFFILAVLKVALFFKLNIYRVAWRFFSLVEAKKIIKVHIIAYALFTLMFLLFEEYFLPFARSIIIIDFFLSILFIGALRIAKRVIIEDGSKNDNTAAMLIGANNYALSLLKEQDAFHVVSVIEEDENLIGSYFSNLEVKSFDKIEEELKKT
jgi:UDP-N-acetyl-D-glucosamine 4,6-dehydratase